MTMTERPLPAELVCGGAPLSDEQVDELVAAAADELDTPREPWRVTDDNAAEWAMRKLAAVDAEASEVHDQAAAWRDEIDRWQDERLRPLTARREFFVAVLVDYLARLRDTDPKVKTRKLPSGTIRSTSSGAKVDVADADAVIAWAESELDTDEAALVVRKSCQLSELRKVATVSEHETGVRYVARLACGHYVVEVIADDERDPDAPIDSDAELSSLGSLVPIEGDERDCFECPPDESAQYVESVEREPVVELVVRDNDTGQIVPGATVRPAAVTYSVSVGK